MTVKYHSVDEMANSLSYRYSQGDKDIGSARKFHWEIPVPICKFWDDFSYPAARNFLDVFPKEHIPIDLDSTAQKQEKVDLLGKLLDERLASKDADAAPKTLYDVDYDYWKKIWLAKIGMQVEVQDLKLEDTMRMMIEKNKPKDPTNLSFNHSLTSVLLTKGKYAEAEATELPVPEWLDSKLGKESPQSLSSRRMIAHAIWKQGRQAEASKLFDEVFGIIDGTKDDNQYAPYKSAEKEMAEKLWKELKEGDSK